MLPRKEELWAWSPVGSLAIWDLRYRTARPATRLVWLYSVRDKWSELGIIYLMRTSKQYKLRKLSRLEYLMNPSNCKLRGRMFLTSRGRSFRLKFVTPASVAATATSPPRHADGRSMWRTRPHRCRRDHFGEHHRTNSRRQRLVLLDKQCTPESLH